MPAPELVPVVLSGTQASLKPGDAEHQSWPKPNWYGTLTSPHLVSQPHFPIGAGGAAPPATTTSAAAAITATIGNDTIGSAVTAYC